MKLKQRLASYSLVLLIGLSSSARSQVTKEDYKKADSLRKEYRELVYGTRVDVSWIGDTTFFWYEVNTRKGDVYYLVDADKQRKREAFDQEILCRKLNEATGGSLKPFSLPLKRLSFSKDLEEIEFILDDAKWTFNRSSNKLEKIKELETENKNDERAYWGNSRDYLGNEPVVSPDSTWKAYIRNYDVWIERIPSGKDYQLSYDGSEGDFYSSYIQWSPDSKKLATCRVRQNKKRYIRFVESSPDDQLQPKLHEKEYLKPGDALPIKRPALFDVPGKKKISVDGDTFEHQYSLSKIKWWDDSRGFTFEFNQRGHLLYQVVEVDAQTGKTRILIEEKSNTFVDYSSGGKLTRHDINDGEEIVWTSERDGWNHPYLFDSHTGKLKNQITQGEWVVREIDHVDEEAREIYFKASGRHKTEDPYLVHYYKIDFDGSNLVELTPGRAQHQASFSKDRQYLVDQFSRADMAPKTVLRDAETGKFLMDIEQADISELEEAGWSAPEVFSAKGRDGETDIWGNIYRPSSFDLSGNYPVIEYIYAGPHSSYVQKTFRPYTGHINELTELGFIVVQIDGMGTNNRSKKFLDVCWQNLKDAGFPDRIRWIKAAAEKYPYMDTTKVGIYGGSAGGQNAMAGLLFYPGFYDAGVAACGCHDNRMDKIWWNEQWMGYPVGPHYKACSNVVNAEKLQGDLLLILGEIDDNVDPASTMQVADALIKAGKDFELVVLPGVKHTLGGTYGGRKRKDFFVKHLLGQDPPDWNQSE